MLNSGEGRVLVVEDQAPMRRLIVLWLRRNGFVVFEAADAEQGLACLRRHPHTIDLAIIDVVGTHGLDLAAEMGRDYRSTVILYISGYIDSLAVQAISWRSPECLLMKPLHERIFMERVRRLLKLPSTTAGLEHSPQAGDDVPRRIV